MNTKIDDIIRSIGETFEGRLQGGGRHYLEVSIGNQAAKNGYADLAIEFKDAYAIVPLKEPLPGMKVRIDGRTFVGYRQFDSGVAIPGYVAANAGAPQKPFIPNDSMVLNFT